jgi:hypothetical protein
MTAVDPRMVEITERMLAWFRSHLTPPAPDQVFRHYKHVCDEVYAEFREREGESLAD